MRVAVLTLAALALTGLGPWAARAGEATKPQQVSGLRGVVMRGPIRPVCLDYQPCDAPAAGIVLQFRRGDQVVARAKTGDAGVYRVELKPGVYTVRTGNVQPIGRRLTPVEVSVPRGRVARIDFHLDTGIQ